MQKCDRKGTFICLYPVNDVLLIFSLKKYNFANINHKQSMNNKLSIYNELPYFIMIGFVAATMKYLVWFADSSHLWFLLKPTDILLGLLTASKSVYIDGIGYRYEELNMVIDNSCSGFNLWIIAFVVFGYLAVKHGVSVGNRTLGIALSLVASLFFTIFANTSRIFVAITFQPILREILPFSKGIIHEAIGVAVNLSFLMLAYIIIDKVLTNKDKSL